jgi:hypothetical protein
MKVPQSASDTLAVQSPKPPPSKRNSHLIRKFNWKIPSFLVPLPSLYRSSPHPHPHSHVFWGHILQNIFFPFFVWRVKSSSSFIHHFVFLFFSSQTSAVAHTMKSYLVVETNSMLLYQTQQCCCLRWRLFYWNITQRFACLTIFKGGGWKEQRKINIPKCSFAQHLWKLFVKELKAMQRVNHADLNWTILVVLNAKQFRCLSFCFVEVFMWLLFGWVEIWEKKWMSLKL